jgi:CubicO group peptidase (beta-lactamase class C family)
MRYLVGAGLSAALLGAAPALAIPKDFKARADAIMAKAYPADGPGAVAVVYEHGKPVYAVGRGLADVERGVPLTAATPMRTGSVTKQFTAAVIMQLAEEGKLSLDDPLSKFLPAYPAPGASVTVRQLLNHTSGIKSYTAIPEVVMTRSMMRQSTGELIDLFKDAPADFKAGTEWRYNNSGYILLGAIIEKVTGKPWWEAVDTRIARPLGLKTLRYGGLPDGEKGVAKGYRIVDDKAVAARPIDMSFPHAAGSIVSDGADLARWAEAFHHGKVVKPASYAQMVAPTKLPDGKTENYGFGLIPGEVRGHPSVSHDGGINGFSTDTLYLTDEGIFVAVMANTERPKVDPEMISRQLAALAIGDAYATFDAKPLDVKAVEPFAGIYKGGNVERAVFLRDGKLFTRRKDGGTIEAVAAGDGRYFYDGSLSWFTLAKGADGKPVMTFHQEGAAKGDVMAYVGPIPAEAPIVTLPTAALQRLTGTYQGPAPVLVAVDGEGQLTLKFGPQPVTHLMPESATLFRVKEIEAKVSFQEEGGKVTGLTIHQGGRSMPIKKVD